MYPTEILTDPDVLVIGGGAAGVAAAVGASEGGSNVVLLEKNGYLGGKATAAYVGTVCGLYYRSDQLQARFVMEGFPAAFASELSKRSASAPVCHKNGLHFLPYDRFAFMLLCDEYAKAHAQALCLHAQIVGAVREGRDIVSVQALVHHKPLQFYPKTVVDTSGDALLGTLLDSGLIKSDEYQASAQVFTLAGLQPADEQAVRISLLRSIQRGLASGQFPRACERLSMVPGSYQNGRATFKLGIPLSVGNDPLDASAIELFSRKAVGEILIYLRSHNELFCGAWLAMLAPEAGLRTGPRHLGMQILEEDAVLNCRKSSDAIARGAWPIEYWAPGKDPEMIYFDQDDYYDIPAGTLQSAALDNLYFGGRNMSASDAAIASARVIGTCLATGYAAGRLAAGQVKKETFEHSLSAIRQSLF